MNVMNVISYNDGRLILRGIYSINMNNLLSIWPFRLKHRHVLNWHLTHTQTIVHVNTLYGSLNQSRRESAFNTLISEAGFNLIYMFPVDGSEPENTRSDSSTSAQSYLVVSLSYRKPDLQTFAQSCLVVSPVRPVLQSVRLFSNVVECSTDQ